MWWLVFKYLTTAGVVVLVSEVARHSDRLGAFIASLPLVTIMVLVWMYVENQSLDKISSHAFYTFWYVLPSLPMFLVFPLLLKHYSFWISLVLSVFLTGAVFLFWGLAVKWFGIKLF